MMQSDAADFSDEGLWSNYYGRFRWVDVTISIKGANKLVQPSDWAQTFEDKLKPLWLAAQAGDSRAYERALEMIAQRLRGYVARRLQALPTEVEDLVQETLMAVHQKRATYDSDFAVTAWVLAIGKYKLVDFWRRHGRSSDLHDDIELTDDVELIATEPEQGARRDLNILLDTLPQAQRLSIQLTQLQGMTALEASDQTGMSVSAIKVNVHRGLKRLSELVKKSS
jgi:RNA polymerase sigma-70 factor, ECF subfamily